MCVCMWYSMVHFAYSETYYCHTIVCELVHTCLCADLAKFCRTSRPLVEWSASMCFHWCLPVRLSGYVRGENEDEDSEWAGGAAVWVRRSSTWREFSSHWVDSLKKAFQFRNVRFKLLFLPSTSWCSCQLHVSLSIESWVLLSPASSPKIFDFSISYSRTLLSLTVQLSYHHFTFSSYAMSIYTS